MKKFLLIVVTVLYAALQIALIAAKLTHRLDISWGWILTPLWAPIALFAVLAVVGIALLGRAQSQGQNPFN